MAVLDDGELVDRETVVAVRLLEVEHSNLTAADLAVSVSVLHGYASDEHPVEVAVAGLQRRSGRAGESAQRIVEGIVGQVGVDAGERGPQAAV